MMARARTQLAGAEDRQMTEPDIVRGPLSRFERGAGFAGLLFALLMTAALLLFNTLPTASEGSTLDEWLANGAASRFRLAGYYVVPFAGVAFMWFMAAIRERGSIRSDRFFDTIFLISGAVFVAMLYAGVGATASLLAAPQIGEAFEPTEETIRTGRLLGFALFNIFAARAAGVFAMVTSGMLLRSKIFPRWVGLLGVGIALVLLLGTGFFRWFIYLFPAWIALVSLVFLVVFSRASGSEAEADA